MAGKKEMPDFPQEYSFADSEKRWVKYWEEHQVYHFKKQFRKGRKSYTVDTPPPTVSGNMHMGHAFSYAQQDYIVRYQRMKQKNVYYPFGTDDNGLPTDRLVERLKKVRSKDMPRKEYIDLCLATIKEIKPDFISDWKRLGVSADFSKSYSTIDPHCIRTAQKSFLDLYKKGHIYQQETPVSWCVSCQTAIAQAEFEDLETSSHFNDIVFKVESEDVVIATTRPELLPSCVAVFCNPGDERYARLVGKRAKVPLFDSEVPILTDERVSVEKGTGIVMCCTFGDKTDIEWWQEYKLPLKISIDKSGHMTEIAGKYAGLKIKEARKQIIAELQEKGLLVAQKSITHMVNVHDKCGTELEFLKTPQWYIRVLDKKEKLLDATKKIQWYPQHMKVRMVHWIENLQWDWCISRQRHFGVPFPVWYDRKTKKVIIAEEKQLPVDPSADVPHGYKKEDIVGEMDVMDTWMTSSCSPQIVLNWIGSDGQEILPGEFDDYYPTSLRPQAHDIIRTWAFYTLVKGVLHNNDVPWKDIVISGHALDPKGKKMSKSKGNVVNPRLQMDKYSVDALRFWAASSKLGDDLAFQEKDLITGKKTVTKLWNASKFVLSHIWDYSGKKPKELAAMDRWLLTKLHRMVQSATESFEVYEYSKTKFESEMFFWKIFCDYYLEIVKERLYNPKERGEEGRLSAQYTLYHSLLDVLKLWAPIMPYITEEVYHLYYHEKEKLASIHLSAWPAYDGKMIDEEAEKAGDLAVDVIGAVRKFKSEKQVSLKKPVKSLSIVCEKEQEELLKKVLDDVKATCGAAEVVFGGDIDRETENFNLGIGIVMDE